MEAFSKPFGDDERLWIERMRAIVASTDFDTTPPISLSWHRRDALRSIDARDALIEAMRNDGSEAMDYVRRDERAKIVARLRAEASARKERLDDLRESHGYMGDDASWVEVEVLRRTADALERGEST